MAAGLEEAQADPVHFGPGLTTERPRPRVAMRLPGRKIPDKLEEVAAAEEAIGTGMGTNSPAAPVDLALATRRSEVSAEERPHLAEQTAAGFAHWGIDRGLGAAVQRGPKTVRANRG